MHGLPCPSAPLQSIAAAASRHDSLDQKRPRPQAVVAYKSLATASRQPVTGFRSAGRAALPEGKPSGRTHRSVLGHTRNVTCQSTGEPAGTTTSHRWRRSPDASRRCLAATGRRSNRCASPEWRPDLWVQQHREIGQADQGCLHHVTRHTDARPRCHGRQRPARYPARWSAEANTAELNWRGSLHDPFGWPKPTRIGTS